MSEYVRELFDLLPYEDRQALYHGDLDLDDVFDENLNLADKRELNRLIRSWGDRVNL
jgi:hypothetical protein